MWLEAVIMTETSTTNTLLLNILEQLGDVHTKLGGIDARLDEGSRRHKRFDETLDMLDWRTDIIEDKVVGLPDLAKDVKRHDTILTRFAAVLGIAMTIIVGVFWFLWGGLSWAFHNWPEIKGFFSSLLR